MHMHMSSKNVAIQRSVYDALTRERRQGESFTELFVRLLQQPAPADEIRGAWGQEGTSHDLRMLDRLRGTGPGRRK